MPFHDRLKISCYDFWTICIAISVPAALNSLAILMVLRVDHLREHLQYVPLN